MEISANKLVNARRTVFFEIPADCVFALPLQPWITRREVRVSNLRAFREGVSDQQPSSTWMRVAFSRICKPVFFGTLGRFGVCRKPQ